MFIDALLGLMLVSLTAGMVVTAQSRIARAERNGSDQRLATRAATEGLLALQTGRPLPAADKADDKATFAVEPLDTPAPGGWKWVSVRVQRNKTSSTLVGLVKEPK